MGRNDKDRNERELSDGCLSVYSPDGILLAEYKDGILVYLKEKEVPHEVHGNRT